MIDGGNSFNRNLLAAGLPRLTISLFTRSALRVDAVQATNATLQQQLAAMREADTHEARRLRVKSAAARPAATRPARTPGPARKIPAASTPSGKTAARRNKRG